MLDAVAAADASRRDLKRFTAFPRVTASMRS